ncbi:MAG TPA: hypothetical protein VFK86_17460 [Bauldia sp.]|nr:hypothetical protein [Bauldia sp.]
MASPGWRSALVLAALLLAAGVAAAQDPAPDVATAPESQAEGDKCRSLCELSFRAVLDEAAKRELNACEAQASCFSWLLFDSGYGGLARFGRDHLLEMIIDPMALPDPQRFDG